MGSLVKFLGGHDASLPPARAELVRLNSEITGLEAKVGVLAGMKTRLELELEKNAGAEREIDDLLNQGARTLLQRLRDGDGISLATISRRAEALNETVSASRQQAEIIRRAIDQIVGELDRIAEQHAALVIRREEAEKAVVRESAQGRYEDYAETLNRLREDITHIAGLERLLAPQRHDHVPNSRLEVAVPNFIWSDGDDSTAILAPEGEVQKAAEVFSNLLSALRADPLAKLGEFPPVTGRSDPDVPYHARSKLERAEIDRTAVHTRRQRETPETARLVDQAIGAARSALGI